MSRPRHIIRNILALILSVVGLLAAAPQAMAQPDSTSSGRRTPHASSGTDDDTPRHIAEELKWLKAEFIIITSASRHEEELFKAAAAVYVVTGDDIRRSGAQNLPDVLRLVPGMSVAQMDANKWAISSRGFNSRFADKLLVLIDGRSVYTPSFSGVYWDMQDYSLEDIERVEVIRGPGGTLWGANAVNGVVNVITRPAKRSQDGFVAGGFGSQERGSASVRRSAALGDNGDVRGYLQLRRTDDLPDGFDRWDFLQGGFRADWKLEQTSVTLQGDASRGREHQQLVTGHRPAVPYGGTVIDTLDESYDVDGQNALARVERRLGATSNWQLQAYWDRTSRTDLGVSNYRNTFDLDFQHRFGVPGGQDVTYGLGYRYLPDHFRNPDRGYINWNPADRHWQLFSAFVQDEITPVKDRLRLTLGSKFEHNDFTGFEIQPNARAALTPNNRLTTWAAVSRAVQVPGRNLDGVEWIVVPTQAAAPLTVLGVGSQDVKSTELIAWELGQRWSPHDAFSTDLTLFYNRYDHFIDGIVTVDLSAGTVTNTATTAGHGSSHGGEVSMVWRASDSWRLIGAYSYLKVRIRDISNSLFAEGRDPSNQASLRASCNVTRTVDLDLTGRYTDELRSYALPGRCDVDARLGWRATRQLGIDVVGRNLVAPRHREFGVDQFTPTLVNDVPRSVFVRGSLRF